MQLNKLLSSFGILSYSLLISLPVYSQKKQISADTYDEWKTIESIQQSSKGNIIGWEANHLEGDSELHVYAKNGSINRTIQRGKALGIHFGEAYCAFILPPQFDSIHQLKLDNVKKEKYPKDTLGLLFIEKDSLVLLPEVESFKISAEGDWMAYLSTKDLRPQPKKKKKKKKKGIADQPETTGHTLVLYNPITNSTKNIHRVKDYTFNRTGTMLAYTTSEKNESDSLSIHVIRTSDFSITTLYEKALSIERITFDHGGEQLLFFTSKDTNKIKNFELSYWKDGQANGKTVVDSTTKGMPLKFTPSSKASARFSKDGSRIFFGTTKIQYPEPKDTLLDVEKAHVDIWSSQDLELQPEQLLTAKQDKFKSYMGVYFISDQKFIQLERPELESVQLIDHGNAAFALGMDSRSYDRARTWEYPWRSDYYWVDLKSGKRALIKKELGHAVQISPSGKYFVWYQGEDSTWMSKDMISLEEKNISGHLDVEFARDNNGMPFIPEAETNSGWIKIGEDEYAVVRDYYDVWLLHPYNTSKSICLTNKDGRNKEIKYHLMRLEHDSTYISLENCLIRGIDDKTKDEAIYKITLVDGKGELTQLIGSNHMFVDFQKAKESDAVFFRRSNFQTYPEIEISDLSLKDTKIISSTNPQQSEYNWGTVEFVEWRAYDSTSLRGLLYKPEDFDPNKKYPMIVYFYELYQDNIHRYYSPRPTASIVYPTEYVSNGYIIFIPDVRYEPGHPAKGAYNCIVSGTHYLVDKYSWIDSTKLGLQGQSWGGYQTAQLVTMTTKYRAAMAGAPVSNMFSAYGGIRWGSGLSRMFQYERYQSRIGATIWERPDLYIENSPIFGLPKVETPLLIMHNDNDGAVPWYQGIEMYMGLRRLDKDVWLLNYNDDEHNLRKLPNKRDLSIRMRQFFDHYLKGAPMPSWMKNGLPAVDKGIETGYELEK